MHSKLKFSEKALPILTLQARDDPRQSVSEQIYFNIKYLFFVRAYFHSSVCLCLYQSSQNFIGRGKILFFIQTILSSTSLELQTLNCAVDSFFWIFWIFFKYSKFIIVHKKRVVINLAVFCKGIQLQWTRFGIGPKVLFYLGTPVFSHFTTARRWYAPRDMAKINNSEI